MFLVQQKQGERGQRGIIGDDPLADHVPEPGAWYPLLPHVLFLGLPVRPPWLKAGREEDVAALIGRPVRTVQETEGGQLARPQAGLLAQLQAGEVGRGAGRAGREASLRE